MVELILKILAIPLVYIYFIGLAFFKWLIVAPICFCLSLFKYVLFGAIIGIIAGIFLSPIATIIIVLIFTLGSISSIRDDMQKSYFGDIYIRWDYASTVFEETKAESLVKKRKIYLKLANIKYDSCKDEFYGFDQIADLYAK